MTTPLTNRETIEKMTGDAYKRGGQKEAEYARKKVTEAAKRKDRGGGAQKR